MKTELELEIERESKTVSYENLADYLANYLANKTKTHGSNYLVVTDIPKEALIVGNYEWSPLAEIIHDSGKRIFLIPIFKKSVKEIPDEAFAGLNNLVGIKLPENIEQIGDSAFAHCRDLMTVDLSACKKLKVIAESAFYYNPVLSFVDFSGCKNLKQLGGFSGNYSCSGVFESCHGLRELDLSPCKKLKIIGHNVCLNSWYLEDIKLPESIEIIGMKAFKSTSAFKDGLDFSAFKNLHSIYREAFANTQLSKIKLPKNLKVIDAALFDNCRNLFRIEIDEKNAEYKISEDGILFSKDETKIIACPAKADIKEFTVPASVKTIDCNAFGFCENLEKVDFSNCMDLEILPEAFYNCAKLKTVVFSKLGYVGSWAFANCTNLNQPDLSNAEYCADNVFECGVEYYDDDFRYE